MDNFSLPQSVIRPVRIGILLLDNYALMSHAATVEPFRAANLLSKKIYFELFYFSSEGKSVASSSGHIYANCQTFSSAKDLDYLLVVAGGEAEAILKVPVHGKLRELALAGTVLGGVSGGPLVLAAAGLLEGKRATVHWEHREAMAQISDKILLENSIFVIDKNRLTCAGGIAPLDLGHALIAQMLGSDFAREVSDWFLHTDIRPSQSNQKATLIERYNTHNATILEAIDLMQNNIADPLPIGEIARLSSVTIRHLSRLFRRELNTSPTQLYLQMRLQTASRLLQNTALSITEIAFATGFSSSAHFSTRFRMLYGKTPTEHTKKRVDE